MKGTLLEGFPRASSTEPKRSASSNVNVVLSRGAIFPVCAIRSWPKRSFCPQRFSDSTQSSDTTGCPSCHRRPSRSVNVYFSRTYAVPEPPRHESQHQAIALLLSFAPTIGRCSDLTDSKNGYSCESGNNLGQELEPLADQFLRQDTQPSYVPAGPVEARD